MLIGKIMILVKQQEVPVKVGEVVTVPSSRLTKMTSPITAHLLRTPAMRAWLLLSYAPLINPRLNVRVQELSSLVVVPQ